jgi:hypothetical protein
MNVKSALRNLHRHLEAILLNHEQKEKSVLDLLLEEALKSA